MDRREKGKKVLQMYKTNADSNIETNNSKSTDGAAVLSPEQRWSNLKNQNASELTYVKNKKTEITERQTVIAKNNIKNLTQADFMNFESYDGGTTNTEFVLPIGAEKWSKDDLDEWISLEKEKINLGKAEKALNEIIPLEADGKHFGKISFAAADAMQNGTIEEYLKRANTSEKKAINDYMEHEYKKWQKDNDVGFWNWLGTNALKGWSDFTYSAAWLLNEIDKSGSMWDPFEWIPDGGWFVSPSDVPGAVVNWFYTGSEQNKKLSDSWAAYANATRGEGWAEAGGFVSSAVEMIPSLVLAYLSGGSSSGASLAAGGASAGGATSTIAANVVKDMVKSPSFWTSFAGTVGLDYQEAIENGADPNTARITAYVTSALNAGIESGSGLEKMWPDLVGKGKNKIVRSWVKSMLEEGSEEVVQGIVSNATAGMMYNHNAPIVSLTDDKAVFNPSRMANEFAGGALMAGFMGGGQIGVAKGVDFATTRFNFASEGKKNFKKANSIIDAGLKFDSETEAYKNAVKLQNKRDNSKKLSNYDVGKQLFLNGEEYKKQIRKLIEADKTGNYEALKSEAVTPHLNGETAHLPMEGKAGMFGENGQKAFEANYREEQDAGIYAQGFNQFYRRGFIGQDYKIADSETQGTPFGKMMSKDQKLAAHSSGVNDAKISLEQQKNNVQFVTTYDKDSGVIDNEIARSYDNEVIQTVDRFAKAVGAKVEFVDTLEGGTVNGLIEDGYIQIAKDAENPVSVVIGHEITHRMQQLAPEQYVSLRNYIVQTNPELTDMVANAYIRAGYTISGGGFDGTRFSRKIDGSSKVGYNKKKGSVYDEYSTNAMIWARSTSTNPGDVKVLNANGKYFALIQATEDGFVELAKGGYKEIEARYERIHSEKDRSIYEDTQKIRSEQDGDMWDMQYAEDGGYAAGNGEQTGSQGLQADPSGNNEHLRSGNQGKSVKYSIKDSSNTATGKTISWEALLDEVTAEYVGGYLLNSPEKINQFIDDARNGKLVEGGTVEENMGVVKRLWQSIKDFIDKVKKLFKGDKKAQDKAAKDAFGMPMSELEHARDLLLETFRESERVVKEKNNPSQSAEQTAQTIPPSPDGDTSLYTREADGRSFDSAQDDSGKVAQEDKTIPQSAEPTAPFAQGSHADGDSVHDLGKDARKTVKVKTETITKADIQSKGKKATFGNNGKVDGVVDLDMGKASAETVFKNSGIAKLRSTLPINENAKQIIFMPEVKGETGGVAVYAVNMKQEQDSRGGSMSSMVTVPLGENQTADFGLIYNAEFVSESGMYQASDGNENVDTLQIEKSDSKVNPDSVKLLLEKIFEMYDKSKSGRKNVLFTFGESDYDTFNMRSVALFEQLQQYLPMSIKSQLSYVSQLYRGAAPTNIAVSGVATENKDISAYKVLDMDNPQRVSGKFSSLVEHIFSLDEGQRQAFLQSLDEQWTGSTAGWSEITPSVSVADSSLKDGAEGKKYSIKFNGKTEVVFERSFAEQVDEVLNSGKIERNHIFVGNTPSILKQIGLPDLPMLITSGHIKDMNHDEVKGITKYHGMSKELIKGIPRMIDNPAIIFDSISAGNTNAICILSNKVDSKGRPIQIVIKPNGKGKYNNIEIQSNFLLSAYGKDNAQLYLSELEKKVENVIYVNKKRTQEMLKTAGLYLPAGLNKLRSDVIIHKTRQSVNSIESKKSLKMDDVLRQNATLKKANLKLREEFAKLQSGNKVADTKRIATVVKNLLDENGFSYNSARLTEQFEGLTTEAQAIFEGKMDFETFSGKVRDVAESVIAEGTRHDSVEYQESKAVRDYLRTTAISLSAEDRANLGDEYETIRKGTFGRFRLVKEGGTPIDVAYREMSELFPEYFSTETEVGASAQLRQIVSVLDGLQGLKTDPFGGYADEAADWLSGMMIDRIFNEVFVSGSTGKVDVSVDMKALRESMGDNLQNIMNRERTWRTREYDKLQKKFEKKTKTYTESRQKAIKIKQVKLHTERISKALVNPSERFAVPEDLKKPVAEFLQCINLKNDLMSAKTIGTLTGLQKYYEQIAQSQYSENITVDVSLVENIQAILAEMQEMDVADMRLSDLSLPVLEKMRLSVIAMETSLRTYNRTFADDGKQRISDLAETAGKEMNELIPGNKKMWNVPGVKQAQLLLNYDMLLPWDACHRLGPTFEKLYMQIRKAMNVYISRQYEAVAKMEQLKEKYGIDKNLEEITGDVAPKETFTLKNGQELKLNKAQVMSLYLLMRQDAAHEHIAEGGVKPGKLEEPLIRKIGKKIKVKLRITEEHSAVRPRLEELEKITDTLSENEKKFAEEISDFFSDTVAEWGNAVSLKMYGYKKFMTPKYFPIIADKMSLDENFGNVPDALIKNVGFANKRIRGANNPVIIEDIFEVYSRHTVDMAKYNAYVLPLEDMQRVFNYNTKVNSEEWFRPSVGTVMQYESQVDTWRAGAMEETDVFELGNTPKVLTELGADELPVVMSQAVMEKITGGKHDIHMRDIKNIPNAIADPIMVFDSKTVGNAFVILTEMKDKSGNDIIVAMHLNKEDKHISVNKIASAYGKENVGRFVETQINEGRLRYMDKKRSLQWSQSRGLQLPKLADTAKGYKKSVLQKLDLVNKYHEQTQSFNIKEIISNKYGEKAKEYLSKLITDINGGTKHEGKNEITGKLMSNYKMSAMGNNLRVCLQQPLSYNRAFEFISAKYAADPRVLKPVNEEIVFKYAPIARWKSWGFIDTDFGKSMHNLIIGKKDISDKTMWLASKLDDFTWKRLWRLVELETADLHPELSNGSEAFYQKCGERFDEIVDRTQSVDSTLHRAQIQRNNNELVKMASSFMSEPIRNYNLLSTAAFDAKTQKTKKSFMKLGRTLLVVNVSMFLLACATGGFDKWISDEDEEYWGIVKDNFVGDWFGMIPFAKDVYSIWQGYDINRMDMNLISKVLGSAALWFNDKGKYTTQYKIVNNIASIADFMGLGASSLKKSLWDVIIKPISKSVWKQDFEYYVAKQMYPVNGKMKGEFLDILFEAYSAGDKESYDKIFADMMKSGIDAKSIEGGLKSRYKKSGIEETFSVPWNNKTEIPKQETPDKFGLEDLDSGQYEKYSSYAVELEKDVVGDIKSMKGNFDDETYNKMLSAAYDYAEEVALEKTAPDEYDLDTEWILNAMEAAEKYGIEPSEYIRCKELYTLSDAAMEQYDKIIDSGQEIDFEKFLDFRTKKWNTDAKDENGVSVNGLKKERLINYLNNMELTDEEWWLLYTEVGEYK